MSLRTKSRCTSLPVAFLDCDHSVQKGGLETTALGLSWFVCHEGRAISTIITHLRNLEGYNSLCAYRET